MNIGVLALQGAAERHLAMLRSLGVAAVAVRTPMQLQDCDGLILPGGESTAIDRLLRSSGLDDAIAQCLAQGMPAFGTCAGLIMLSAEILDGRPDQHRFAAIDVTIQRNGYGRQINSFETDIDLAGATVPAVFIRAPKIVRIGSGVKTLARHGADTVLCESGQILGATFHPELTDDGRIHRYFIDVTMSRGGGSPLATLGPISSD